MINTGLFIQNYYEYKKISEINSPVYTHVDNVDNIDNVDNVDNVDNIKNTKVIRKIITQKHKLNKKNKVKVNSKKKDNNYKYTHPLVKLIL